MITEHLYNIIEIFDAELVNNSMEQIPSSEANRFSLSQEIPHILWNPKVHYHIRSTK